MMRVRAAGGPRHGRTAGAEPAVRLAVLGDSSAAGFGAPDHERALAGRLAAALGARTGRAVSWRVSARGGATARSAVSLIPDLLTNGAGSGPEYRPEVVLVVAGVNDTTRLRRPSAYGRDMQRLIAAVRHHLGHPVPIWLAGLPPMGRFPGLPRPVRHLLGAHARRLDQQLRHLADRTPETHHLPVGDLPLDDPALFAADGFHPAPAAYEVWGHLLAAQAAPLLGRPLPTAEDAAPD